ncbi:MAG: 3-deoxy-7-phosphoheptulonate synthase [Spirochaetaceae bacterium]|jgi:3-deoxy-7-phosphoheptulonate synthase|nr:3-deoxy-7-phosphoheptulonate synthase [Spirochaetaceae bacterium]
MIVVLSKDISEHDTKLVRAFLEDNGYKAREQTFGDDTLLSASGKGQLDTRELQLLPGVVRVAATSKPYELASRETQAEDSIVTVGPVKVGGARITVIAGPCAVESREQIAETAARVRESGAVILRGGAFKPRTSPYAFQGLGMKGLEYMKEAGEALGMPIVTEVVSPELALQMKDLTDMFQIGARNMQNFELLKRVGSLGRPVLLKRGASATIEEWLLSAEYLLASGARDVILCERGIRTFETFTRNTLDISAIPVVKGLSHLPVIVDPSHALGIRAYVNAASLAAVAVGADGLAVEVHTNPDAAFSDGPQSLYPDQFEKLMRDVEALAPVAGKELQRLPSPKSLAASDGTAFSGAWTAAFSLVGEKVAFSGRSGAFAERALINIFGEETQRLPVPSFSSVFDAVLDGSAAFGVVPVENSLTGSIHENYDLFLRYPDIVIVGELKLRIVHCLMAIEGTTLSEIKTIRSHAQGFAQCRNFLDEHTEWYLETHPTTADAVLSIAKEKSRTIAAIASEAAAKAHGLNILKAGIENNPQNYTRFVVISRKQDGKQLVPAALGAQKPNKASLVFSVADKPGSLLLSLQCLSGEGINMTKLESRPILGQPWNYLFYVDFTIPEDEGLLQKALEDLKKEAVTMQVLGVYRAAV